MNTDVQYSIDLISASFNSNWTLCSSKAGAYENPEALLNDNLATIPATTPSTVAQAHQDAQLWSLNSQLSNNTLNIENIDQQDWWYHGQFNFDPDKDSSLLVLMGLASLCDVWINGHFILSSDNMFITHSIDIEDYLKTENDLVLCFRSVNNNLSQRRPRPRWKTKLVSNQQLRWIRTTLLGRIPGWTPPIVPIGPWQPIFLQAKNQPFSQNMETSIHDQTGVLEFFCKICSAHPVTASLEIDNNSTDLKVEKIDNGYQLSGQLKIQNIQRWWPHTHGQAKLYSPTLSIVVNNESSRFSLPPIGFKDITLSQENEDFEIKVNGKSLFCRGACWTINDIVSLSGEKDQLEHTLQLMRDAGANMIRIGGTMIYESETFYRICDKLGILVWQDFMFANMDYPIEDESFKKSVQTELTQVLSRLRQHVCIAIYCGNSEIQQQIAMLGLENDSTENKLFSDDIPQLCSSHHQGIPYVESTPIGGAKPFHTNKNLTHYYGVGAYMRPISELRQHNVQFTSECLGFANVPVTKTRNQVLNKQLPVSHHPRWKERVPRDSGAGWDFEDVRDHYLKEIFNVDSVAIRSFDSETYFKLSEVVSGEVMSQVFSEWRSNHSQCNGGLVWFMKDFWPGAGWGIIDSNGLPKACYYYLKRCWQTINICITNESLNGLDIHAINETSNEFSGKLEVILLNKQSVVIATNNIDISIPASSTITYNADKILSGFHDVTYSYRFGSPQHSIVVAQLKNNNSELICESYYFLDTSIPQQTPTTNLSAMAKKIDNNHYQLELNCSHFLYAVNIDVDGYTISDNYFHMLPNESKFVIMKSKNTDSNRFKGYVSALNLSNEVKIKVT